MVSARTSAAQPHLVWPPDDTEESVVGTDRHQMTIINLRLGINECAATARVPGEPVPWHALSQTMLTGLMRRDSTAYTTLPDIFVYPHAVEPDRGSVSLALDGPPVLIVEVASESTYPNDLDLATGKPWSYARGGVREYLVIDPTGRFVPEWGRGWRLEGEAYVPWMPDAQGRWQSREIPIAIGVADGLATVYSGTGERQLHEGEVGAALREAREALAERDRQIARQQAELDALRRPREPERDR